MNNSNTTIPPGSVYAVDNSPDYVFVDSTSIIDTSLAGKILIGNLDVGQKLQELDESITEIKKMLCLIEQSTSLEDEWEDLREAAEKYRQLKETILEKKKIISVLGG